MFYCYEGSSNHERNNASAALANLGVSRGSLTCKLLISERILIFANSVSILKILGPSEGTCRDLQGIVLGVKILLGVTRICLLTPTHERQP